MIQATRHHPTLGLILDAQYEEPMTPLTSGLGLACAGCSMQVSGPGLGWITVDSDPANPGVASPTGRPPIPYFQNSGLGYYAANSMTIAGAFDSTGSKIALALGLALGIGGGVALWRRRGRRR